jgi:hypothetical protein
MAYALIPDGYTLKKVTKDEKQAVNEKRRHDDVVAVLSNEAAATGIIALSAIVASGSLLAAFMKLLKEKVTLSKQDEEALEQAFLDASLLLLPISPAAFAVPAAKATAERLSKWISKLQKSGDIIT